MIFTDQTSPPMLYGNTGEASRMVANSADPRVRLLEFKSQLCHLWQYNYNKDIPLSIG